MHSRCHSPLFLHGDHIRVARAAQFICSHLPHHVQDLHLLQKRAQVRCERFRGDYELVVPIFPVARPGKLVDLTVPLAAAPTVPPTISTPLAIAREMTASIVAASTVAMTAKYLAASPTRLRYHVSELLDVE